MEGNPWGDGKVWVWAPVVWDGSGCRDEADQAGRGDVSCQEGDRIKGLGGGEGLLKPLLEGIGSWWC